MTNQAFCPVDLSPIIAMPAHLTEQLLCRLHTASQERFLSLQVGDELAVVDPAPGEAHNYFALLDMLPPELTARLVKQQGCVPSAFKVAALLGVDLVDEVLSACVQPVLPPPAAYGHRQPADRTLEGLHAATSPPAGSQAASSRRQRSNAEEQDGSTEAAGPLEGRRAEAAPAVGARAEHSLQPLCSCALCTEMASLVPHLHLPLIGSVAELPSSAQNEGSFTEPSTSGSTEGTQSISKGRPARRKSRLPGIRGAGDCSIQLTVKLLNDLAAVAPLRATVAAVVQLLQRHGGLSGGLMPVVPPQSPETENLVVSKPDVQSELRAENGPPASLQSGAGVETEQQPAAGAGIEEDPAVKAGATDRELLNFALEQSAEKFPPLQRWLQLQLETNPALAHLRQDSGTPTVTQS